jgi:hypothetical protein
VPRIESGRDLYVLNMRNAIEKGQWAELLDLYEKKSAAQVNPKNHELNAFPDTRTNQIFLNPCHPIFPPASMVKVFLAVRYGDFLS